MKLKLKEPMINKAFELPILMSWYRRKSKKLLVGKTFNTTYLHPETFCIYNIEDKNGDWIQILAKHTVDRRAGKMEIKPLCRVKVVGVNNSLLLHAGKYVKFQQLS